MISGFGFVFVMLPCVGACLIAALIRDWRLASAALCGALGLLFIMPALPDTGRTLIASGLPFISGVAVGAAVLIVHLLFRPTVGIWSRMTSAMMGAFLVHFIFLIYVIARV